MRPVGTYVQLICVAKGFHKPEICVGNNIYSVDLKKFGSYAWIKSKFWLPAVLIFYLPSVIAFYGSPIASFKLLQLLLAVFNWKLNP